MIQVTAFAFTGYPVTDLKRARAFYEGLLGLKPATTWVEGETGWVEYELGDATLAITNGTPDKWKPSPDGPAVALEVADFNAAVSALRAAGVKFLIEPMDGSTCGLAVITDPDGNSVAIHHRKPAA